MKVAEREDKAGGSGAFSIHGLHEVLKGKKKQRAICHGLRMHWVEQAGMASGAEYLQYNKTRTWALLSGVDLPLLLQFIFIGWADMVGVLLERVILRAL
ncbi:hypothetical protein SLEP1_g32288 [Rubroshorea leprosula]|uniref:Uncharacterized protein n=1 Tax=Rubroshorea leprosula TaxID=152421 RepID=A0AAV5KCT3_9ROSI|nr:hypothetical protein SLEP1_g32288 [Rubroshorea leprosula]